MNSNAVKLVLLGTLLVALAAAALSVHAPGAPTLGSARNADRFVAVASVMVAVYLGAVALVRSRTLPAWSVWVVLGVAVLLRAMLLAAPPFLSSDIYRYVWDGRVQDAGINPYRYLPADPALGPLRDAAVFPHVNRAATARTIYPPTAELVFAAVGRIAPGGGVPAMKLAMVAFEALGVFCLLRLLAMAGLPAVRILIYAWNPLVLWSFALDGHVDAIAVGLLGAALLARATARPGWSAVLLAGAALVKFLPVVVAPAFARGTSLVRFGVAGGLTVVGLYALYLSAGWHVLGFLGGYDREEGLTDGRGIWLLAGLRLAGLNARALLPVYLGVVAAVLGGFGWVAWRRVVVGRGPAITVLCRDTAVLCSLAIASVSPHYTWYYGWLALPSVVAPVDAVVWLSSAPVLLYLDPVGDRFTWEALVWLPALCLALRSLAVPVLRGRPRTAERSS